MFGWHNMAVSVASPGKAWKHWADEMCWCLQQAPIEVCWGVVFVWHGANSVTLVLQTSAVHGKHMWILHWQVFFVECCVSLHFHH